jgi:phosphotransferase system HPr (HPr) family protein
MCAARWIVGRGGPEEPDLKSIEVLVRADSVLHARPAAAFVRAASGFASTVRLHNLTSAGDVANAKSITAVMAAGVRKGHRVRIVADGIDEDRAVDELGRLLAGLGEPVGE